MYNIKTQPSHPLNLKNSPQYSRTGLSYECCNKRMLRKLVYSFLMTSIPCIDLDTYEKYENKYENRNSISHSDKFLIVKSEITFSLSLKM